MTVAQPNEYAGASVGAIQHHYDLGNAFYRIWLDESMTYSCALSEEGDTLEAAQARKLDYLIEAAGASGASRVLDIGCGWGSLITRLLDEHGVEHVTGLTLSDAQAEQIGSRGDARVDVRVENWIDHQPDEPYDAIISIGAFEHFARFGLPRAERVESYRHFFTRCHQFLRPRARLALQTNAKGGNVRLTRRAVEELRFVADRIFPESELPWASEILEASERIFDLKSVRNDPDHYALTCATWLERLRAGRDQAVELVGPKTVTEYERYLEVTVDHFRKRYLALLRLSFQRV